MLSVTHAPEAHICTQQSGQFDPSERWTFPKTDVLVTLGARTLW
jgi:hypothetical protein